MPFQTTHRHRVGLFGGAFNPPHRGHVEVCRWMLERDQVDEIWVIPCFLHPFGKPMIAYEDREAMCRFAFAPFGAKVKVVDVERQLGGVSHTVRTILHVRQKSPEYRFFLITGSDNQERTQEWLDFEEICRLVSLMTVPRGEHSPIPDISASDIRERIEKGRPFSDLVPTDVAVYIVTHRLYR